MKPLEALNKYFGHSEFRPGQSEIIEAILSGKNVLSVLPTGAGKSLCFQIPALITDNYSIVISPLIALMKDQVDSMNRLTMAAAFINSTQTYIETERILNDINFGKIKLVYVAPERLENREFAERLKSLKPAFLFIDEAHCISQWGHNFRPSYTKIKNFIEFTGIKKVSAFTATATPEVVKDIIKQLGLRNVELIVRGFERDNLCINVEITRRKKERCLELLQQHERPAVIYTSSRKRTEELSEYLQLNKIKCDYYHAGLDPLVRKKIQEDFISDRLPVIIATNAFGMGIDKRDIRLVIHFSAPGSIENYYQEIGRAGRDGRNAFAYMLYDDSDLRIHEYFISNSYPTKELIKGIYNALCDSARIALGTRPEKDIKTDMRYIRLHMKEDISASLINTSLRYLQDAGYLRINSAFRSANKVKVLFEQERLKSFLKRTTNGLTKTLLLYLLRNTGSDIFKGSTNIDIEKIRSETGLTSEEIYDTLTNLDFLSIVEFTRAEGKETLSLLQPRIKADELRLNYKLINEFYISSSQKLDSIPDYVYSNECRFRFILKYFGEKDENYECGKCDNCLKDQQQGSGDIGYIKEKILDLIKESGEALNEKQILYVLSGIEVPQKFLSLRGFSALRGYSKTEIIQILKLLRHEGVLKLEKDGRQKVFVLSDPDKDLKTDPPEMKADSEQAGKTERDYQLNLELFHVLREIRNNASKKFLQSADIICPDSLMSVIAQRRPGTRFELLSIQGFNDRMFNKVGSEFLEAINSFEKESGTSDIQTEFVLPQNIKETFNLLQKGYSLADISKLRKLTEAVISMQIETILDYLPGTDISGIIDDENLEIIRRESGDGFNSLRALKERLPENFTYPVIRIALAKIKARP